MSGKTTRRAFVGGGLAVAAGAGIASLDRIDALTRRRHTLALSVDRLYAHAALPAFGTIRPDSAEDPATWGELRNRHDGSRVGSIAITPLADSAARGHTLTLADGTLVAAGAGANGRYAVVSGTGRYAGATGHVTARAGALAALDIDIDLEL
jgi:hypothetical protein